MPVTNTVAGLNQTIGLLQAILNEIRNDKTVQPATVSTVMSSNNTTTTTSQTNINDNTDLSLSKNSLSGISNSVSVIKTIANKETIQAIKSFAELGLVMKGFRKVFTELINTINYIDELKVNEEKTKSFDKILTTLNNSIKMIPTLILSLIGIVVAASLIGVIAPLAWKQILIGFGVISGIVLGAALILKIASTMLGNITFVETKDDKNKNLSAMPQEIANIIKIFLGFAGMILVATIVGVMVQTFGTQILTGMKTIAVIIAATIGILYIVSLIKPTLKDNMLALGLLIACLYATSLQIVVAWGVGELTIRHFGMIMLGFTMMTGIIAAITGILHLIDFATTKITSGKDIKKIFIDIALLSGILLASSLLILVSWGVGELTIRHFGMIMLGFTMMTGIIAAITGLLFVIGKLASNDKVKIALTTGAAVIGATTLLLGMLTSVIMKIVKLTERVKGEGGVGWNNVWQSILSIAGIVSSFTVLFGAIGVVAGAIGWVLLAAIPTIMSVTMILDKIVDVTLKILKTNKKIGDADISKIGKNIVNAFKSFATTLVSGFEEIGRVKGKFVRYAHRLTKMIDPVMKFVEMIKTFAGDKNTVTLLSGEKVNLDKISTNIALMFSQFANHLSIGYDSIDIGLFGGEGTKANKLNKMIDPISKFINILSNIKITKSGDKITNVEVKDENGKFIKVDNPTELFSNISTLLKQFADGVKLPNVSKTNTESFTSAIDAIQKSIDALKDGNSAVSESASAIGKLTKSFKEIDDIIVNNEKKRLDSINKYKESIQALSDELNKVVENLKEIKDNSKLTVAATQTVSQNIISNGTIKDNNKQNTNVSTTLQNQNKNISTNDNNFDFDKFEQRLLNALGNNTIRVKFNNSTEDLIGELQVI